MCNEEYMKHLENIDAIVSIVSGKKSVLDNSELMWTCQSMFCRYSAYYTVRITKYLSCVIRCVHYTVAHIDMSANAQWWKYEHLYNAIGPTQIMAL